MKVESRSSDQDRKATQLTSARQPLGIPLKDLSDQQRRAAELLVAGVRPGMVAKGVGISREQLWRWRTQDPAFMQYIQELRIELQESRVDRVWTLVDKALDVVNESLDEGDPQTAMQLLRLPGLHLSDADVQAAALRGNRRNEELPS